jgi:mRNA interferase RelE/StbE
MAAYKIFFKKTICKDFEPIPKNDLKKILKHIGLLSENPRPSRCRKLSGQERYRLRQGRYPIIYSKQDDELSVWAVKVGHRKDIYK